MKAFGLICFCLVTAMSQDAAPLAAPGTADGDAVIIGTPRNLDQAPAAAAQPAATTVTTAKPAREPGLYATIKTSMGDIKVKLYEKQSPLAVKNFAGLATGTRTWTDPRTGKPTRRPLYSGTTFHRVIPNFMIQGGDPLGNGMGTPGYKFDNENSPDLMFDRPGVLAMANAGPNTNGSQFFITVAPYPSLNGGYTIFGRVLEGQEVADKISQVPRDGQDKPLSPVTITRIVIERVGPPPVQHTATHSTTHKPAATTAKPAQ
jgi:peptidyl-prolyl cis-trans isomerase A (cyclophilin A)